MASPEELLCLEAMVTVLAKPAFPRKNHAATGPCKATPIWQPLAALFDSSPIRQRQGTSLGQRTAKCI
jgi:hypothetical protein